VRLNATQSRLLSNAERISKEIRPASLTGSCKLVSAQAVPAVKTILEEHPWYGDRWRGDLENAFNAGGTMGRPHPHEGPGSAPGAMALHQLSI